MAKQVKRKKARSTKKASVSPFKIYWEKSNYLLLTAGILLLIIGFYIMSIGSWDSFPSLVISPIILFIAYIFIFPASILYRNKSGNNEEETANDSGKS